MAEALKWESAMAAFGARAYEAAGGAVAFADAGYQPKFAVRGRRDDEEFLRNFRTVLGFEPPDTPNRVSTNGARAAFWLRTTEWLVTTESSDDDELRDALKGSGLFFTPVGEARVGIRLSGPRAPDLLWKSCGIDVDRRVFAPGHCAQTRFAQVGVLLHRPGEDLAYEIICARIWAEYLWNWLVDAAHEFEAA